MALLRPELRFRLGNHLPMRHKGILIAFLFLLCAGVAHAQSSVVPDPVQYTVSPENPGPNQAVNILVEGVGQFLGNSKITWQQNGQTITSAANQTSFSFTTGGIGTATRIRVTIDSPIQGLITKEFVFNPSVVNLVWEADTYTPFLYKGKALYSAGSNLKVVAFPTVMIGGTLITPNKLSFQWRRNDTLIANASGLGKNVFSFQGDQLQPQEDVSVTIYSGTTPVARGEISIPASDPKIILYVQDPLRGELFDQGLAGGDVILSQTETTFKAEPFFFAATSVARGMLKYSWVVNNEDTTGPDSAKGLLTLRQTGKGQGAALLGVSIENADTTRFAQTASTLLRLTFGSQSGSAFSSFFGL